MRLDMGAVSFAVKTCSQGVFSTANKSICFRGMWAGIKPLPECALTAVHDRSLRSRLSRIHHTTKRAGKAPARTNPRDSFAAQRSRAATHGPPMHKMQRDLSASPLLPPCPCFTCGRDLLATWRKPSCLPRAMASAHAPTQNTEIVANPLAYLAHIPFPSLCATPASAMIHTTAIANTPPERPPAIPRTGDARGQAVLTSDRSLVSTCRPVSPLH